MPSDVAVFVNLEPFLECLKTRKIRSNTATRQKTLNSYMPKVLSFRGSSPSFRTANFLPARLLRGNRPHISV